MLSKPWGLWLSVGVLLSSPRCFRQYQPPAATSATMTRARSRLSTTSATKLPEAFSAEGGNAVRLDPLPGELPPASAQHPGQLWADLSQPELPPPHLPLDSPGWNGSPPWRCT